MRLAHGGDREKTRHDAECNWLHSSLMSDTGDEFKRPAAVHPDGP